MSALFPRRLLQPHRPAAPMSFCRQSSWTYAVCVNVRLRRGRLHLKYSKGEHVLHGCIFLSVRVDLGRWLCSELRDFPRICGTVPPPTQIGYDIPRLVRYRQTHAHTYRKTETESKFIASWASEVKRNHAKSARRRRKHCALAVVRWSQSMLAPPQTPSRRPKFNQLEMVTTLTYKPSLVKIDALNFELSW